MKMHEKGLLQNKKLAIIEPDNKNANDRNFCFWSTDEEVINLNLSDLINTKLQHIKVADREK